MVDAAEAVCSENKHHLKIQVYPEEKLYIVWKKHRRMILFRHSHTSLQHWMAVLTEVK
jgi:hypothetical protein